MSCSWMLAFAASCAKARKASTCLSTRACTSSALTCGASQSASKSRLKARWLLFGGIDLVHQAVHLAVDKIMNLLRIAMPALGRGGGNSSNCRKREHGDPYDCCPLHLCSPRAIEGPSAPDIGGWG